MRLFLLNSLYSLRRHQPQNVILDLGYSLIIYYKHFQSKYCESLRVRINKIEFVKLTRSPSAQKMMFSVKDFFSKCDQIWQETADLVTSNEEFLNEKLHFCAVTIKEWGGCQQKLLQ